MAAIRLSVELELDPLIALAGDLGNATQRLHAYVRTQVLPALQPYIDKALNQPGPPRKGKFVFASLASQRYYFATHKGPYRRTNKVLSWRGEVEIDGDSGEILAVNPVEYSKWVFGSPSTRQAIGHQLTGWKQSETEVITLGGPAQRLVVSGWFIVNDVAEAA